MVAARREYEEEDEEYQLQFDPALGLDPVWVDRAQLEMVNAL